MIVEPYYENLKILHVGTEETRAYYIPASSAGDYFIERQKSDRFELLNGTWQFHYEQSVYDLKCEFYREDAELSEFVPVAVPGMWQYYGVEKHQYTNVRYPFPMDPPYVPRDNPCGAYVRKFQYSKIGEAPEAFLNFEGVDSCFYVWLNGKFVGYSQVSHSTSEFHVTDYLREGENTLAVLVLKWCDGSYLEDQDKFRMSGIFRDVYLLKRPVNAIRDYKINAVPEVCNGKASEASVYVKIDFFGNMMNVDWSFYDYQGKELLYGVSEHGKIEMHLQDVKLWNAEQPYLYTLVLRTAGETITEEIGIREIHVTDGILYINEKPVKFHGVNRHDSDPETGFVISREKIEKDLYLMKAHNVNAIRTSHYPNCPQFYHLYDRYGFYIIDEADNESHGTNRQYLRDDSNNRRWGIWGRMIADNSEFISSTIDRTKRLVIRDQNRPSVVIWSMGNECAYGCTFDEAIRWTKQYDDTRLVHYEGARYMPDGKHYDRSILDLYSRMYPDILEIHEYFRKSHKNPFLMCEYSHAMGNGPGDLEDYFKVIHQYDGMCGGFIWEWCDHAVYHTKDADGHAKFLYGGDNNEFPHDGNFCVDGLVFPDRRIGTGLKEFACVYRPARIISVDMETGTVILKNYLDFTDLKDYLTIRLHFVKNGQEIGQEDIHLSDAVPPQKEGKVRFCTKCEPVGDFYIRAEYMLKNDMANLKAGAFLGQEEVQLSSDFKMAQKEATDRLRKCDGTSVEKADIEAEEGERFISIKGTDFLYEFDKFTGGFSKLIKDGKNELVKPMEYNIFRAPTDNDRKIRLEWEDAGYDRCRVRTYESSVEKEKDAIVINTSLALLPVSFEAVVRILSQVRIDGNGKIHCSMQVKRNPEMPFLPRFGVRMFVLPEFSSITYNGLGPDESYEDKHHACWHDTYSSRVEDMYESYIRPQENGSHCDCTYVLLSDPVAEAAEIDGSCRILVYGDRPVYFNASRYSQEQLAQKAHNWELEKEPYTVLCLDYRQSGIGSGSCGPQLLEKYRLNEEEFTFEFNLELI